MRSKNAVYNIIFNLLLQLIAIIYGFIVPKIIICNYGSNVNGLISSITQFLAYIALLESGFGPVVKSLLYKPIAKKDTEEINNILSVSNNFFKKLAYILVIYILILCIFYPMIVNTEFNYFFTSSLIIIISISNFAEYYFGMTFSLYLQAEQKSYIISIIQIITYILNIMIVVFLSIIGVNIHVLKLVCSLSFVLRPLLQNLYVKKKYNLNLSSSNSNYTIKQKWDGLAQHIASVIHNNTDITILTLFCNLSEVSVYSVYFLVVSGIKKLIQSFSAGIDSSFGDMIAKGETNNLKNKFQIYEVLYFSITTVIFTCAMVLIVPFIENYTRGITDVNYIRYCFGYLIVISEYLWAIRLPYSSLTLAAGHFKETKIGAWVECFTNIIISIVLVNKMGITGVAIGTIIAMAIRTIEFVHHTNKFILYRSVVESFRKILILIFETLIIILLYSIVHLFNNESYFFWFCNALICFVISSFVVFSFNFVFYKKEMIYFIKKIIRR